MQHVRSITTLIIGVALALVSGCSLERDMQNEVFRRYGGKAKTNAWHESTTTLYSLVGIYDYAKILEPRIEKRIFESEKRMWDNCAYTIVSQIDRQGACWKDPYYDDIDIRPDMYAFETWDTYSHNKKPPVQHNWIMFHALVLALDHSHEQYRLHPEKIRQILDRVNQQLALFPYDSMLPDSYVRKNQPQLLGNYLGLGHNPMNAWGGILVPVEDKGKVVKPIDPTKPNTTAHALPGPLTMVGWGYSDYFDNPQDVIAETMASWINKQFADAGLDVTSPKPLIKAIWHFPGLFLVSAKQKLVDDQTKKVQDNPGTYFFKDFTGN